MGIAAPQEQYISAYSYLASLVSAALLLPHPQSYQLV